MRARPGERPVTVVMSESDAAWLLANTPPEPPKINARFRLQQALDDLDREPS